MERYLAIVLLLGLVGGLALGALAGARRTQSSFPKFLRSTNPSDLFVHHDDGLLFDQDRLRVTQGRMLDANRRGRGGDEQRRRAGAAHASQRCRADRLHERADTLRTHGTAQQTPVARVGVRVVGIVAFNFELVRDDFDRSLKLALLSPALTRPLRACCENGVFAADRDSHADDHRRHTSW